MLKRKAMYYKLELQLLLDVKFIFNYDKKYCVFKNMLQLYITLI